MWPDWAIYWTLGSFLKPLATINLPKSLTLLGNFFIGVKSYRFSSEIIFGQLLETFGDFFWSHCSWCMPPCGEKYQKVGYWDGSLMKTPISVTRRPDCVFNIWPFSTMKICPKAYKMYQSELTADAGTLSTKHNTTLPKTFNLLPKIFK